MKSNGKTDATSLRPPDPALQRVRHSAVGRGDARGSGRALHELRHSLLPHRLPGEQPDPGLERPRLSAATGKRPRATCTRPTTSRNSPAACARRRAKRRARSTSTTPRSPSRRSNARSSTRRGRTAGCSPSPPTRPARRVAVIGAGPAGLAAAQQLARAGHEVDVFEKNAYAGGLLRYGIPDFKMEKHLIDRRVHRWKPKASPSTTT